MFRSVNSNLAVTTTTTTAINLPPLPPSQKIGNRVVEALVVALQTAVRAKNALLVVLRCLKT